MSAVDGKRVFIVTNAIRGVVGGGSGTANTFLSFALRRAGHDVELLVTSPSGRVELDPRWAEQYARRGITVRLLAEPRPDVVPGSFRLAATVRDTLERDPPDIVVVDAWSGSAYMALRLRDLGLAFDATTFVVSCNGPTAWAYETDQKLPRSFPAFEIEAIERASIELADAVVSPSRYLLQWMSDRGWKLPRAFVAPLFTYSAADGEAVESADFAGRLRRIAFFGRLEERKGLTPFIAALNALEDGALSGVELAFVGRETAQWTAQQVADALSADLKGELSELRFETSLDQPEAIAFLKQAGTVAVVPSLLDNSPNVVYECLEHGIPFLAGNVGGIPELVAAEDRDRTLVVPTAEGIRAGLERLLAAPEEIKPVRPSFDGDAILAAWEEAISSRRSVDALAHGRAGAIVIHTTGADELKRCLDALAAQTQALERVVVVGGDDGLEKRTWPWPLVILEPSESTPSALRAAGLRASSSELVLLLDDRDEVDRDCVETLLRAQAASQADVVTCATRQDGNGCHFLGEPHELGLVGNYYGLVALCRRSVLENAEPVPDTRGDTTWVLFAALSLAGAKIVSVPRVLASTGRTPGKALTDAIGSGAALAVARAFERRCPPELRELPRLAASLAARRPASFAAPSLPERLRWIWEHEGAAGVALKVSRRLRRRGSPRSRL